MEYMKNQTKQNVQKPVMQLAKAVLDQKKLNAHLVKIPELLINKVFPLFAQCLNKIIEFIQF
jgi:hypothetical protein